MAKNHSRYIGIIKKYIEENSILLSLIFLFAAYLLFIMALLVHKHSVNKKTFDNFWAKIQTRLK